MSLRVGHIAYANCVPFFHYLRDLGFAGGISKGVPAQLNARLAAGAIDLSPSSAFEYGCHWRRYVLLPDLSISACGPVQSVLLFSSAPLETLADVPVTLTGESATSINLLRLLCLEYYGFPLRETRHSDLSAEQIIASGGSALLIGDRALKTALHSDAVHVYDLGQLWWQHTGLPFVFALWIVRRELAQNNSHALTCFYHQLRGSLARAESDFDHLARLDGMPDWLEPDRLAAYWRAMSYRLTDRHRQGLETYFRLAFKHGLLAEMPEVNFFQPCF